MADNPNATSANPNATMANRSAMMDRSAMTSPNATTAASGSLVGQGEAQQQRSRDDKQEPFHENLLWVIIGELHQCQKTRIRCPRFDIHQRDCLPPMKPIGALLVARNNKPARKQFTGGSLSISARGLGGMGADL
jgi:hypothetical protein